MIALVFLWRFIELIVSCFSSLSPNLSASLNLLQALLKPLGEWSYPF